MGAFTRHWKGFSVRMFFFFTQYLFRYHSFSDQFDQSMGLKCDPLGVDEMYILSPIHQREVLVESP